MTMTDTVVAPAATSRTGEPAAALNIVIMCGCCSIFINKFGLWFHTIYKPDEEVDSVESDVVYMGDDEDAYIDGL